MAFWRSFRPLYTDTNSRRGRLQTLARWGVRIVYTLVAVECGYIAGLLPDWEQFLHGPVQKSSFIQHYEYEQSQHRDWPRLQWYPIELQQIPKHVIRAVIVAEDSRFFEHQGFDQTAFMDAMEFNLSQGRVIYGASTISQQTIKNYLLSPSRNPLRKLHEAILTYAMEQNVGKKRIMEIYLNIAEFGRGIYGVEAAARHYWGKSAHQLSLEEAIDLAATLPGPVTNNPDTRSRFFRRHREKIRRHLSRDTVAKLSPG